MPSCTLKLFIIVLSFLIEHNISANFELEYLFEPALFIYLKSIVITAVSPTFKEVLSIEISR